MLKYRRTGFPWKSEEDTGPPRAAASVNDGAIEPTSGPCVRLDDGCVDVCSCEQAATAIPAATQTARRPDARSRCRLATMDLALVVRGRVLRAIYIVCAGCGGSGVTSPKPEHDEHSRNEAHRSTHEQRQQRET